MTGSDHAASGDPRQPADLPQDIYRLIDRPSRRSLDQAPPREPPSQLRVGWRAGPRRPAYGFALFDVLLVLFLCCTWLLFILAALHAGDREADIVCSDRAGQPLCTLQE